MVLLASKNLHGPRCLNMCILSSLFFFEWHQVVLGNWLKYLLVVSLGWSHRPRCRLVRHEIIVHQLIHDAAGGWVRLPKLVMECAMLVSHIQVRQRIDLVTKFSICPGKPQGRWLTGYEPWLLLSDTLPMIAVLNGTFYDFFPFFLKKKKEFTTTPLWIIRALKKQLWHSVSDMEFFFSNYSQHFQATICQGRVF